MRNKEQLLRKKEVASLAKRITVTATAVLLCMGLVLLLVFGAIRLRGLRKTLDRTGEAFLQELLAGEQEPEWLSERDGTLCLRSVDTGKEVYRVGMSEDLFFLGRWAVFGRDGQKGLFGRYKTAITLYEIPCEAEFVFDCTKDGREILAQMLWFGFWYLLAATVAVAAIYFMNKAIFLSVHAMSEQVNRMTLQDIHTNRLDVEKTEEELKDLAAGINRMLDRMEEAYESQKQFVSEASHELRTPITVLQGYSGMLRRWGANDPEVLAESVEAIESEAKSMQDLVEKLLFLSRHERKKLPFSKERFDMAEVVRELEKEFSYMTDRRALCCPVCESVSVYGDRQLLKQALRVFVDNAVKYTEDGDRISVFCKNKAGACEITVEDTGLGMGKEELEGIFARFFRGDTVRGKNIEGHGLGLSIARLIIDGHAGKIAVRTQYTKGSTFIITIPRQRG